MEIGVDGKSFASLSVTKGKGDQVPMGQPESCSRIDCSRRAVTLLGEEHFCFDHFCRRCYELLERGDCPLPQPTEDYGALAALLRRLEECAQRALEISLSEMELNNLDRARLLDILLWSGDVTTALRHKRGRTELRLVREEARPDLLAGSVGRGRVN